MKSLHLKYIDSKYVIRLWFRVPEFHYVLEAELYKCKSTFLLEMFEMRECSKSNKFTGAIVSVGGDIKEKQFQVVYQLNTNF